MFNYNVMLITYPPDSNIEETLIEKIMNYDANNDEVIYISIIEDVEMNNITEDLDNYIRNGFEKGENKDV